MAKFDLYFGIKGKTLEVLADVECVDSDDALAKAEDFAHEVYYLNPNYDVNEIMEIEGVDEGTAMRIFNKYMGEFTEFHVEEV